MKNISRQLILRRTYRISRATIEFEQSEFYFAQNPPNLFSWNFIIKLSKTHFKNGNLPWKISVSIEMISAELTFKLTKNQIGWQGLIDNLMDRDPNLNFLPKICSSLKKGTTIALKVKQLLKILELSCPFPLHRSFQIWFSKDHSS